MEAMTDKEAFELMVKYSSEKEISLIKHMIYALGVEETAMTMIGNYEKRFPVVPDDFKSWICKGLKYLHSQLEGS